MVWHMSIHMSVLLAYSPGGSMWPGQHTFLPSKKEGWHCYYHIIIMTQTNNTFDV